MAGIGLLSASSHYAKHLNFNVTLKTIVVREERDSLGANNSLLCLALLGLICNSKRTNIKESECIGNMY